MHFILFILILVVLILVHEFGHFIVAKKLGIRVIEFSIGFPPRIGKIHWRGTDYSFGALLFGGYVKLLGENEIEDEKIGLLNEAKRSPDSFAFASGWKQAVITLAGVGMNFLFAWLAFIAVFMAGVQVDAASARYQEYQEFLSEPQLVIQSVAPESPATEAGLTPGDVIVSAKSAAETLGNPNGESFQQFTAPRTGTEIILTVQHGSEQKELLLVPQSGIVEGRGAIGVELADLAVMRLPPWLAVGQGTESFAAATLATAQGLGMFAGNLIRGQGDFSEVAGPVGIARMGAESVSLGFSMAMLFAAIISINLAILNLLPIPGLDGGRLLFIVIERIKGSAINPKVAARIMIVGFVLLGLLMVAVTYHDIIRLF
jgi:regulator of sigma E protease